VEEEFTQREGIVVVDAIPLLEVEPLSATLVEEEEQAPTTSRMDIDMHDNVQGHKPLATGNPKKPSRVEATHITNGSDNERT
jgi:hypothetical protein